MKVPKIDSPCPLRWGAPPTAQQSFCTKCARHVHDLSGLSEAERRAFFASRSGKVCIAYTVPRARAAAALRVGLGVAAAIAAAPSVAQDRTPEAMSPFAGVQMVPYAEPAPVECDHGNERAKTERLETIVLLGGVNDAQNVRWVEADAAQPQLPVLPDDAFLDL